MTLKPYNLRVRLLNRSVLQTETKRKVDGFELNGKPNGLKWTETDILNIIRFQIYFVY